VDGGGGGETDETTRALSNAVAASKNDDAMLDVIHDGLKFLGKMIMFYDRQKKFLQGFRELAEAHGAPNQWTKTGAKEIVEALLSAPNKDLSNSPLHTACAVGGLDAIKWLIKYGGNKHVENDEGLDPVSMLCAYHSARMEKVRGQSRLETQMLKVEAECLNFLIDEGRFSIDHVDLTGMQPLHFAAKNGAKQLVTMLLERGADPFRTPAMNLAANAGAKGTTKSKYASMKPSQIAKKERHLAVFVVLDEWESKVNEQHQREVDKVFPEKDCEPTAEEKARLAEVEKDKAREAEEDRRKVQEVDEEEAKRRRAIEEAKQSEAEESKRKLKQAWEAAEKVRASEKEKFKKEAEELKRQTKDSELAKRKAKEAEESKRKAKEAEEAKRKAKEAEEAKRKAKEAEEAKRKAKEAEEAKRKAAKEAEEAKRKAAKEAEEAKRKAAKEAEEAKRKAAKEAEAAKLHDQNSIENADDGSPPTVLMNKSSRSQSISNFDDIIPPQLVQYAIEHSPYTLAENDTDSSPSTSAAKMLRRQRYGTGVKLVDDAADEDEDSPEWVTEAVPVRPMEHHEMVMPGQFDQPQQQQQQQQQQQHSISDGFASAWTNIPEAVHSSVGVAPIEERPMRIENNASKIIPTWDREIYQSDVNPDWNALNWVSRATRRMEDVHFEASASGIGCGHILGIDLEHLSFGQLDAVEEVHRELLARVTDARIALARQQERAVVMEELAISNAHREFKRLSEFERTME
jgi:ankyrin repeat protein